jgi:hypothetical protein
MSLIDLRPKFISQGVGKLKLDKKKLPWIWQAKYEKLINFSNKPNNS